MFDLSNITLKPCPFYGGEAYISMHLKPHVECFHKRNCKIRPNTWLMSSESLRKQIKAWNQRSIGNDSHQYRHQSIQQNNLEIKTDKIHIGEVVYTKSDVCVLDIGLVESTNPLRVCARCIYNEGDNKSYYGNPSGSNWYGTGIYKTYNEWKDLTIDGKGTYVICNILGIPYYMKGSIY